MCSVVNQPFSEELIPHDPLTVTFKVKLNVCYISDVPELVIADRRREQNVTVGTPDYKLECSYRGLPAPQIVWYKDDEEISDLSMYTINVQSNTEDNSKYEKVTSTLEFKGSS